MKRGAAIILAAALFFAVEGARAGEALAAVAANFKEVADALAPRFEAATGHRLTVSLGSTGALYAQIVAGAPFDVLLAADQKRPRLLAETGAGIAGTRFTYAVGRLVLWSARADFIGEDGAAALRRAAVRHVAIAHPKLAPYGAAARQALERLGPWEALRAKIVTAENIGQAFAMVATGNAELGLIALSSLAGPGKPPTGSRWIVPETLHDPIRQDAILLARAHDNAAARAFLDYLKGGEARVLIERYGYGTRAP